MASKMLNQKHSMIFFSPFCVSILVRIKMLTHSGSLSEHGFNDSVKNVYVKYDLCVCTSGIDPPDAEKEKTGILALQIKERDVPHSVSTHSHNTQL